MFSESFMKFLLNVENVEPQHQNIDIKEIPFRSIKVQEAAKVVVASIKETF